MSALDRATAALVLVAAALNDADEAVIERRLRDALAAGADPVWLDELVLLGVLVVGFPRALVFAGVLRRLVPRPADAGDGADYEHWRTWARRGAETCHAIYRDNYTKLRENVATLHPVLDPWIVVDGYGRILGRPGLDTRRRELCHIAILAAQGVPRQLHSHLRGALNVGASPAEVEAVFDALDGSGMVTEARVADARALWKRLDVH